MVLWTSNDNPAYLRAVYEIETTKADIQRMENELRHMNEGRAQNQSMVELLEANLEFIRKYSKIVSLREYLNLKQQLRAETDALIYLKNQIPMLERQIEAFRDGLARLEATLPNYESKVLEFVPRA